MGEARGLYPKEIERDILPISLRSSYFQKLTLTRAMITGPEIRMLTTGGARLEVALLHTRIAVPAGHQNLRIRHQRANLARSKIFKSTIALCP